MSTTPKAEPFQFLPELAPDEYESLKADIARNGIAVPVEMDENGTILDGHHRVKAWTELKKEGGPTGGHLSDYPRIIRKFHREDDKIEHALKLNLNRRHIDRPQLKALAFRLWNEKEWGYEKISAALGVAVGTAHAYVTGHPDFQDRKSETVVNERGQERPRALRRRAEVSVIALNEKQQKKTLSILTPNIPADTKPQKTEEVDPSDVATFVEPIQRIPPPPPWLASFLNDIEKDEPEDKVPWEEKLESTPEECQAIVAVIVEALASITAASRREDGERVETSDIETYLAATWGGDGALWRTISRAHSLARAFEALSMPHITTA